MDLGNNLEQLLIEGGKEFTAVLDKKQVDLLLLYKEILKEWNEKFNLTAIEEDKEVIIKHFIDSLSVIPYIKNEKLKLIDIGTGAGFPGIPLKVVFNNLRVTLLDSLDKRVKFLNNVIQQLKIEDIQAVHGRAEDFGANLIYREKFDVACARAVASLPVLLEYCLPFVKLGGVFIAMKGSNTEEINSSKKALGVLGGAIEKVMDVTLPFTDMKRNIIIVRKFRQTPTGYPRKAGKPSKEPLI